MISKMNKFLKYLTLSLTLALSACGGGGGGSSAPATPLTSAQILGATKSANSAGWILSSVDGLQGAGLAYLSLLSTTSGNNITSTDLDICPTSGSYTATWNIADITRWTQGDSITLNLTDCVKSDGYTYNGSETYTVTTVPPAANTLDITITSDLTQLTVSTPNSGVSSTPLTTVTFTSNNTQLTWSRTWNSTSSTYTTPSTYESSGSMVATLNTSAGNIASGTYTVSQAKMEDRYSTSTANTRQAFLVSSDGTYNNVVLKNIAAKESSSGFTTAYPKYLIAYANAAIVATVSSLTTTLSGENSDGSLISDFISYKYFD
jgi:hypothetical protein